MCVYIHGSCLRTTSHVLLDLTQCCPKSINPSIEHITRAVTAEPALKPRAPDLVSPKVTP